MKNKVLKARSLLKFCVGTVRREMRTGKQYPLQIQFPITYRCNSRCVMCDVWNMDPGAELTVEVLERYLKDPLFKKVRGIGINGGEPSLVQKLPELADVILELPELKSLNVISNGLLPDRLLEHLSTIYDSCKKKGVSFSITISMDGYGDLYDSIRGIDGGFDRVMRTVTRLRDETDRYCDSFALGCTVTKYNVLRLAELDSFIKSMNIPINYWLGVDNLRTDTAKCEPFKVLDQEDWAQAAMEFFYGKYCEARSLNQRFTSFARYYYLKSGGTVRLSHCDWQKRDVTLESNGSMYYCAARSKCIGNLNESSGENIALSKENRTYRRKLCKEECSTCIHYTFAPSFRGLIVFLKHELRIKFSMKIYKVLAR